MFCNFLFTEGEEENKEYDNKEPGHFLIKIAIKIKMKMGCTASFIYLAIHKNHTHESNHRPGSQVACSIAAIDA